MVHATCQAVLVFLHHKCSVSSNLYMVLFSKLLLLQRSSQARFILVGNFFIEFLF